MTRLGDGDGESGESMGVDGGGEGAREGEEAGDIHGDDIDKGYGSALTAAVWEGMADPAVWS